MTIFTKLFSAVLLTLAVLSCSTAADTDLNLLVGTYTSQGSHGIYSFTFNQDNGTWVLRDSVQCSNPSYLAFSPDGSIVYAVNENGDETDAVEAFAFDSSSGSLVSLGRRNTDGIAPCYLSTDGKFVLSANYGGTMNAFPIDGDGSVLPLSWQFSGTLGGPDTVRQIVPHVHCATFTPDGGYAVVSDFSADRFVVLKVNGTGFEEFSETAVRPDSGPRHIVFSPSGNRAYSIGELSGEVTVFEYGDGNLSVLQTVAADTLGGRGSGDIRLTPDGKHLYASNRLKGDGIAIFSVNPEDGKLTKVGYQDTGIHPRNFTITPNGKYLLCACRDSNLIQVFEIDAQTGLLSATGNDITMSMPVFVGFNGMTK